MAAGRRPFRERPPRRQFLDIRREHPEWPEVLAEGDSWFAHDLIPHILFHLSDFGGYAIRRLAFRGRTLERMVRESPDRVPKYLRLLRHPGRDWRFLLFSGGGNDLLRNDLPAMLRDKSRHRRGHELVIRKALDGKLALIRSRYESVLGYVDAERPDCDLLVHGYDYPFPRDKGAEAFWGAWNVTGPWIQPTMERKGIEDATEQREIVAFMIDELNDGVLASLDRSRARFHHVDLRETLPSVQQWDDEIHPKSSGFRKMARAFARRMNALVN